MNTSEKLMKLASWSKTKQGKITFFIIAITSFVGFISIQYAASLEAALEYTYKISVGRGSEKRDKFVSLIQLITFYGSIITFFGSIIIFVALNFVSDWVQRKPRG